MHSNFIGFTMAIMFLGALALNYAISPLNIATVTAAVAEHVTR